ncbi:MAG TPA: ribose 5-phosphate isomerase B [Candidatus Omnitrophota bacterium]|nr:ribose 5-phosphate isomerase B [Candidatus Omnitrophota bacterium]HPD84349.1 ribose 5-phosphate isomerase B [Candidatus Omnitrophota bacterium]HRZ03207.1 ribose 5-phosphate isomerase B [Candidatus Omnitrophota bacterium]
MKIFIGADHRGFDLKKRITESLRSKDYSVEDVGSFVPGESCDYPRIACSLAKKVVRTKGGVGILICMTGIGNAIAANKVKGIRAALCYNKKAAFFSRAHNDANVLVISSLFIKPKDIMPLVLTWLKSEFEGGRHARRVNQIKKIEQNCLSC